MLPQDSTHLIQRLCYQRGSPCQGQHEVLLMMVKRRKLQWYGHVSRSSGLAKTVLQGTMKGGRRQGGQRKRWEDNIREWTGLEFGRSHRAVESREKWRKSGCKIICGAPTALAVKGFLMMMSLPALFFIFFSFCSCVCFWLYGPFNCISFHEFSRLLSALSLCS